MGLVRLGPKFQILSGNEIWVQFFKNRYSLLVLDMSAGTAIHWASLQILVRTILLVDPKIGLFPSQMPIHHKVDWTLSGLSLSKGPLPNLSALEHVIQYVLFPLPLQFFKPIFSALLFLAQSYLNHQQIMRHLFMLTFLFIDQEWSNGDLEFVIGEPMFEPGIDADPSFTLEFMCSPPLNRELGRATKTISLMDQLLIALISLSLYSILTYIFSIFAKTQLLS